MHAHQQGIKVDTSCINVASSLKVKEFRMFRKWKCCVVYSNLEVRHTVAWFIGLWSFNNILMTWQKVALSRHRNSTVCVCTFSLSCCCLPAHSHAHLISWLRSLKYVVPCGIMWSCARCCCPVAKRRYFIFPKEKESHGIKSIWKPVHVAGTCQVSSMTNKQWTVLCVQAGIPTRLISPHLHLVKSQTIHGSLLK